MSKVSLAPPDDAEAPDDAEKGIAVSDPASPALLDLTGCDADDLNQAMTALGLPGFRAKQVWRWVWRHGLTRFDDMTDLAKPVRERLAGQMMITRPTITSRQKSTDGTIKWLLRFADGNEAEAVYIPEDDRGTLCVSSQVGCTLTCTFCHTGTQRLVRNLTTAEITGQVLIAMDELGEWPATHDGRRLTNIVMMGMGEPLFNYDNVAKALKIIMSGEGIGLSKRRITLSTSGIVPEIIRCGDELGVNLAISLHATNDALRDVLVPINRKYPLKTLINACNNYPVLSNARRITWEYVMLNGINDSDDEARALVKLIKGIPSKINLIPFNPWPGSGYERSSDDRIDRFAAIVMKAGYASPIRTPRGEDILAACGQLKTTSERLRKSQVKAITA